MAQWPDTYVAHWMEMALDYPTKAILYMSKALYHEQSKRLVQSQAQLDGSLWQREQDNGVTNPCHSSRTSFF